MKENSEKKRKKHKKKIHEMEADNNNKKSRYVFSVYVVFLVKNNFAKHLARWKNKL
jgi:hypothetical protein